MTNLNRESAESEKNKSENFAILSSKKDKYIGQKRKRNKETVDTVLIRGLQNFDKYGTLNPIEIKTEEDRILRNFPKYCSESYIYRFLIDALLFRSRITNEASILFIAGNALTDAYEATINGKTDLVDFNNHTCFFVFVLFFCFF